MSSRSKTLDSSNSQSADIVSFRKSQSAQQRLPSQRAQHQVCSATLLSIRQHLRYKACVAVSDKPLAEARDSDSSTCRAMALVRTLLNKEFGSLRVHRHRQLLIVSHHCMESLIGGLLRVQFLSKQVEPDESEASESSRRFAMSWGVGESLFEAETARFRQVRSDSERP